MDSFPLYDIRTHDWYQLSVIFDLVQFVLAGYFYVKETGGGISHSFDWVPLTSLIVWMAAYTLGTYNQ